MPPHPSDEALAFNWPLSERAIAFSLTNHRGPETLCRLAIQLCVLRQHGRFLPTYTHVSPPILGYRCRQRDLMPWVALSSPVRSTTATDYQRALAADLGWRGFEAEAHTALREWVVDQVAPPLYVEDLVEQASARLHTRRIILPGRAALERTVKAAHAEAAHQIVARLAEATESSAPETSAGGTTDFFRCAPDPPAAQAKPIVTSLAWAAALRALHRDPLDHVGVGPPLLARLSTAVRTYDAPPLKAFAPDKRYALAAGLLDEPHTRLLASLRALAETVLAWRTSPEAPLSPLLDHLDPHRMAGAVADGVTFERLARHGLLDKLHGTDPNFRRSFGALPCAAASGRESLLDKLALLRQRNQGELPTLPPAADTSGVPGTWRGSLQASEPRRRRTWEIALALRLQEALRSGEVFLPDSRRPVAFGPRCYAEPAWPQVREAAFDPLGLATDGTTAIKA
jgi:hypothetical protein